MEATKLNAKKINNFTFHFTKNGAGFTLIELLVTLSIMGILSAIMIANIAGQRINQRLKIAQNELVTNIRKIQSYSLSAREILNGQSVQYYILKIDLSKPTQYTIQAMYDVETQPKLADIETINLPDGIRFASNSPLMITRPVIPLSQAPAYPGGCALVVFKMPFAKTLLSNGCSVSSPAWDPDNDSYEKVLNFVTNVSILPESDVSADSSMQITLSDANGAISKTVTVNGISGLVTFN